MMYRYTYQIFWSEEDEAFIAIVPDVPDLRLVSAFGDTPHEALQELMVALSGVEESYRKAGEEMPAPVLLAEAG